VTARAASRLPASPEVLTPDEECKLPRVSWPTLRDNPRIPYLTVGKVTKRPHRRYLRSVIVRILEQGDAP